MRFYWLFAEHLPFSLGWFGIGEKSLWRYETASEGTRSNYTVNLLTFFWKRNRSDARAALKASRKASFAGRRPGVSRRSRRGWTRITFPHGRRSTGNGCQRNFKAHTTGHTHSQKSSLKLNGLQAVSSWLFRRSQFRKQWKTHRD